ncbi:MAG TPA: hypothetical protein VEL28_19950 [Candidatus Binatia bacterium]|nr:hypothetical protein [Candidatus Binatia bacterium]
MAAYADELSLGQARRLYFDANGFGEGGYEADWVRLQAGPLPIWFPNTASRVRSVRLHDLHHVVTGYDTTWTGESEIGAWELGSGCADHWAAWLLNFNAMAIGLAIAPRATYAAFRRGRRTCNLYGGEFDDAMLAERVGEIRRRLRLDTSPAASARPGAIRCDLGAERRRACHDGRRDGGAAVAARNLAAVTMPAKETVR